MKYALDLAASAGTIALIATCGHYLDSTWSFVVGLAWGAAVTIASGFIRRRRA